MSLATIPVETSTGCRACGGIGYIIVVEAWYQDSLIQQFELCPQCARRYGVVSAEDTLIRNLLAIVKSLKA